MSTELVIKNSFYKIQTTLCDVNFDKKFQHEEILRLSSTFFDDTNTKVHSLKNHVHGLVENLKLNNLSLERQRFAKRQIHTVNFGINVGSEINGIRPSIVYKNSTLAYGQDIIVIPLTTALESKNTDKLDIFIYKDDNNKLLKNSYARARQIRAVSIKRIGKKLGVITNPSVIQKINTTIIKMLAVSE